MKKNLTRQWVAALMVVAGLLTALPIEAQKETKDISDWSENTSFGKNGANLTADGYSLWHPACLRPQRTSVAQLKPYRAVAPKGNRHYERQKVFQYSGVEIHSRQASLQNLNNTL